MRKKNHSRPTAVNKTGEQPVQVWDSPLGVQNETTNETSAQSENLSVPSSHSERDISQIPSNVVQVRYIKGKDNLLLEDAISKEIITLTPGDNRRVHMNKTLVQQLVTQGFTFEFSR
jgi:hypothetical protein